jgi:hypothetical protein
MPSWVLTCGKCGSKFDYCKIDDADLQSHFSPTKPDFPPGGFSMRCANCGSDAIYERTNLTYRA